MLSIEITGVEAAGQRIRDVPRQVRFATSQALNETAFAARLNVQAEMRSVFDRPTPWIQKTIFVKPAKPAQLEAQIYPEYLGGKSVEPSKVLWAEVFGGDRRAKRSERALRRIGVLPPGMVIVPGKGAPLDAYGNIPGSFLVRLLAYFEAFGEQGYSSNMNDKGRARLAKVKRSNGALKVRGVQYFVSYGKGTRMTRAVNAQGQLSRPDGQAQHLPAGIWSRTGTHGSGIKPILMFVRAPRYSVRLRIRDVVEATVQRELPQRYAKWIGVAIATAK